MVTHPPRKRSFASRLRSQSAALTLGTRAKTELESGLGNIESSVEGGVVVLTHPCKCEPRAGASRRCSINGSSLEQWMRMPHASGRPAPVGVQAKGTRGSSASPPHRLQPARRSCFYHLPSQSAQQAFPTYKGLNQTPLVFLTGRVFGFFVVETGIAATGLGSACASCIHFSSWLPG
jgi:hypothetical protein